MQLHSKVFEVRKHLTLIQERFILNVSSTMASGGDKSKTSQNGDQKEKKRKESILDLSKYLEKTIRVKFAGGREASGILKGYDPLLNLVLDNTIEYLRDPDDAYKLTEDTRELGLVVCRGTSVVLICPMDGMESIQNPFVSQD
ncbi:U6 snRNA-associated Sm-like protein LSm7 [Aethina tumida]|uniref:U6 snRNA-associated Sm-like protein LSm7 n=1 Tax=Aethina tumida TaxID=116153 RepID=UPI00096AFA71|nr:U6 snRNA-associated Sm-like protein LSm7 [Aethina tumida]